MFGVLVTGGQKGAEKSPILCFPSSCVKRITALASWDATKAFLDANLKTRRDL